MTLGSRLERLRKAMVDGISGRMCLSEHERRSFGRIVSESYSATNGQSSADRRAEFLSAFAERWDCSIPNDELIVGSQKFGFYHDWLWLLEPAEREKLAYRPNQGHIIVDYGRMLRLGVDGVRKQIESSPAGKNTKAFLKALEAFSLFVSRHGLAATEQAKKCPDAKRAQELRTIGANCEWISHKPASTFWQGLQLVWFIQIFLHAEGGCAAVSFGRFDQYLWPLLENDLREKQITMEQAQELVGCFWIKTCEGDESQNLTLGGIDAAGKSAENPLSLLCLEVTRELKVWQPSISVRIGETTSEAFWTEALKLCSSGLGMPSFFNDSVVRRSLETVGIPEEQSWDWGIVGCYEATTQGDTCGMTTAIQWNLAEVLLKLLAENRDEKTFEAFYEKLKNEFANCYRERIEEHQRRWEAGQKEYSSPFQAVCLSGCIESGLTAEEGGANYSLYGINILGLGTVVDSLLAIHELIYKERALSFATLREQLSNDFSNAMLQTRCRNLSNRYGTDTEFTNRLARELSEYISTLVLQSRIEGNGRTVRPCPGFFAFAADIYNQTPATPDGRRTNELLSYGCGPAAFTKGLSAVSVLNSAANVVHDRCACGNPLLISIQRSDVKGEQGLQLLRQMINGYFRQGGFHLHFNILDADQLRRAQERPEEFPELMVRVSGFSAKFKAIDKRWQDAIIERTEKGL